MEIERNLGPQPIAKVMSELDLKPHQLVEASNEQLTHKMVARGRKGRRLKRKVQEKILQALNNYSAAQGPDTHRVYTLPDLFNYKGLF